MLQAEVTALKTLVLTSTPSTPNKHLHPQIDTSNNKKKESSRPFWKTHRRSTSHHEFTKEAQQESDEVENGQNTEVRQFISSFLFNLTPFPHYLSHFPIFFYFTCFLFWSNSADVHLAQLFCPLLFYGEIRRNFNLDNIVNYSVRLPWSGFQSILYLFIQSEEKDKLVSGYIFNHDIAVAFILLYRRP